LPSVNIWYGQYVMADLDVRNVLFHGLADPSRQRIIGVLRAGPARVNDVVGATGMLQPNVSTHLACLWECGLAERERRGREVHYRLADGVEELLATADRLLERAGERIASCPNYGRGRRRIAA
jgi:ArsR family transcriptional regulator, cadmium/lead-responsive transcriptional repressor